MSGPAPFWLEPNDPLCRFPDPRLALRDPDGLLAIGGDLSPERLLTAYRHGIFPWYSQGQPILWWSPDPRAVLYPARLHVSRSLRKRLRQGGFRITLDTAFDAVIEACAHTPRQGQNGTWITEEMKQAYRQLHRLGHAHSVEAWEGEQLVGGLYGIAIGAVFFGESMFSHRTDASKVAFAHLVRQLQQWQFALIDCQVASSHLASLGAEEIPRERFLAQLLQWCPAPGHAGPWTLELTEVRD